MRRKFTLLMIIALSSMSALAHSGSGASRLNLLLFDDGNFTVVLDGIRYPDVRGTFRVPQLHAGTHRIKIVENFFGRRGRRTGREVLYAGPMNIPYNAAVTIQLTPNNRLKTLHVVRNPQRHSHRRGYRPAPGRRNAPTYNRGGRGGYGHGQGNRQSFFQETKRSIRMAGFEQDRMALARQAIRQQNLNAHQVAQLMNMMNFESSRLQLAKFGYRFSAGHPNYFNVVSGSLTYASSRRELLQFIRTFR